MPVILEYLPKQLKQKALVPKMKNSGSGIASIYKAVSLFVTGSGVFLKHYRRTWLFVHKQLIRNFKKCVVSALFHSVCEKERQSLNAHTFVIICSSSSAPSTARLLILLFVFDHYLFNCCWEMGKGKRAGSAIKQHLDSILLARWTKGFLTAGAAATTTDYSTWNYLFSFYPFEHETIWPHFPTSWHRSPRKPEKPVWCEH